MPTTTPASFESFFQTATTVWPYKYQVRLATTHPFPDVLDVPTGLGKTAAVVLGWLWQRRGHRDKLVRQATPRRLVYCLPMRVLVEQTFGETIRWLHRLGCLDALPGFDPDGPAGWKDYCPRPHAETADKIAVHLLMGGEPRRDWDLFPERDAILIGTQDMLLSRALNRGYGMSRFRWPMHFGMLGNDCLWVMDEVQLMGSGLGTTVQVDLFQKKFWPPQQPCHFLWMSATLGQSLLRTRDREDLGLAKIEPNRLFALEGTEKQEPAVRERLTAEKQIEVRKDAPSIRKRDGSGVLDRHQADRITLVILNTVPVAQGWFRQLRAVLASESKDEGASPPEVILLHSRFRPPDRQRQLESLQRFVDQQTREMGTVEGHLGLIIVSTQVIEAGIDLSSIRLWSEIAPWASVVQRLGRLNREGKQDGATAMFWMPGGTEENDKGAPNESKKKRERIGPYLKKDLETARKLLDSVRLRMEQNGEGRPYREALDEVLQTEESQKALEVEYEAVIRPHDFLDLFATEPDLAGGFTDVSRFVRDQDRNVDAYVFWREAKVPERGEAAPSADELCPVPFYFLQLFLGTKGTVREWDLESGKWIVRRSAELRPGMTLRLWQKQGGYNQDLGWTGNPADVPNVVQPATLSVPDQLSADEASQSHFWLSLADHTADVMAETNELVQAFELSDKPEGIALSEAAPWHDVGKTSTRWKTAIDRFLTSLRPKVEDSRRQEADPQVQQLLDQFAAILKVPGDDSWAKFPDVKWLLGQPGLPIERRRGLRRSLYTPFQPGFRHEAASALVAWKGWQEGTAPSLSGLAIYLIATHHGKVRTVLRSIRGKDAVFGLCQGEELPPVDGLLRRNTPIPMEPRRFGASGQWDDDDSQFKVVSTSWVSMVAELLGGLPNEQGPAAEEANQDQPTSLGPFRLAFLEMLFRVADARASAGPGRGRSQ